MTMSTQSCHEGGRQWVTASFGRGGGALLPWCGWVLAAAAVFLRYLDERSFSFCDQDVERSTISEVSLSGAVLLRYLDNTSSFCDEDVEKCHYIGGAYPERFPVLDLYKDQNRNAESIITAAFHILAYGEKKYLDESYDNAVKLATLLPQYDVLVTVDDSDNTKTIIADYSQQWKEKFHKYEGNRGGKKNWPKLLYITLTSREFDSPEGQIISRKHAPANYKRMNRWRIKTQFEHPLIKKYNYIIQMDSNLLITHLPCDPVQVMVKSRSLFGYYNAGIEQRELVSDFNAQWYSYVSENKLTPTTAEFWGHLPSTSGGFLVFDTRLVTSRSYRHFAEFVDSTELIFSERLADQNVYPYAVNMLTMGRYVHKFSGFAFEHKGGWGGDDVYTDATHPLWHRNGEDPFCRLVSQQGNNNLDATKMIEYEQLREELFWANQLELRNKNAALAKYLRDKKNSGDEQ